MWGLCRASLSALLLSGCVATSIQGYADRQLPANPVRHIAAYVAAPAPLAASMQASIAAEAQKHGIQVEDALTILPPTRTYKDAEIRKALTDRGIDGVLLVNVADSGVRAEYAGTIFQSSYSGTSTYSGTATNIGGMSQIDLNGTHSGTTFGSATPTYRYSRQTKFSARLVDPKSARNLWVGTGEVDAGGGKGLIGRLIVSDGVSSSKSMEAIFDDLQKKGLIGGDEVSG